MLAAARKLQGVASTSTTTNILAGIEYELAQNPYGDLLSYKSTQTAHFYKDVEGKVVNRYQKPLSLYLQLLKMFASPGSVVLDATMGTGSLEVAAMESDAPRGLEFIAVDKNEYQMRNAENRLKAVCTRPTSLADVQVDVVEESRS